MKIGAITSYKQPTFQAVNQKYLKKAEDWYKRIGDIDSSILTVPGMNHYAMMSFYLKILQNKMQ